MAVAGACAAEARRLIDLQRTNRVEAIGVKMAFLIALAVLVGLAGLLFLSNATTGVGVICFACLFAIFARIAQAEEQHKELKRLLDRRA